MRRILAVASALLVLSGPVLAEPAYDPVTQDPPAADPPPSMDAVAIPSGGADLNGIVYEPGGKGPHPVVILLHGLPGNEQNLDLAQAMRRAGWAVVYFHYRGSWGSPGAFGFRHVIEDVNAAVNWTLDPSVMNQYHLDRGDRVLVGHSMGGFAALEGGANNSQVGCIASISGANMGMLGERIAKDAELEKKVTKAFDVYARGPLSGTTGALMVAELREEAESFDVLRRVDAIADHPLLLVAGSRDRVAPIADHHAPLLAALKKAHAQRVTELVLDDDHAYSGSRIALAHALVDWLGKRCHGG